MDREELEALFYHALNEAVSLREISVRGSRAVRAKTVRTVAVRMTTRMIWLEGELGRAVRDGLKEAQRHQQITVNGEGSLRTRRLGILTERIAMRIIRSSDEESGEETLLDALEDTSR